MITHCNETISGLDTIRAFGKETWFMSEMINRIDNHTKVFLIISSSNRWLGIALVSCMKLILESSKFIIVWLSVFLTVLRITILGLLGWSNSLCCYNGSFNNNYVFLFGHFVSHGRSSH